MIDELKSIAIFSTVVEQGSFRGAARALNLSPSVISYHITLLETKLDTALLYRSTRKLSLTEQGQQLFKMSTNMLKTVEQGLSDISAQQDTLSGKVTVSLPTVLIRSHYTRVLAEFCQQHPRLEVNFHFSDVYENLIEKGIDIAIRLGDLPNSELKSKKLGNIKRKLTCSPLFLKNNTLPKTPKDLENMPWIRLASLPNKRTITHSELGKQDIHFGYQVTANSVEGMTQLCMEGLGIATPADFLVEQALRENKLIELLPEWQVTPIPAYAIWPNNVTKKSATMAMVAHLAKAIT
ncbi:LysR family transcriptional regulator [Pseudoalteromonas umbrosa]|uniref:LysR family transcriptional regulator n=1 Tax=Pseudoalteromonas umbrosa TaxID=3048489 RepID=UPI0024C37E92|nr:LysR family transcriptional regulator [Pseudoalteromonas sp. B95]MDK1287624.1 LysR family transcriptional regulator [Pseudoalteromonas sp. B95]